jgi:two-component system, OmpR family, response regulator
MSKKRILIVDDEVESSRLLKSNLEQTGNYEARVENCPEDAVAAAHEFEPHLVLLDILMPRMSGGNVVAAFEADPLLKHLPIIFLTAAVRRRQVEDHQGIICEHPCLAKPASMEEIVRCIESNWSKKVEPSVFRMNTLPREVDDED